MKVIQESEFFIGISSGLSWLSWATNTPTVLISGFTDDILEPKDGVYRVINKNVCNSCWSHHEFDPGDWSWCPVFKNTKKQFECSKTITSSDVIKEIEKIIKI
jgi:autotransporter strand-loop-strand O-heptosyltransferase